MACSRRYRTMFGLLKRLAVWLPFMLSLAGAITECTSRAEKACSIY
jgi:hypothetical protein